MENKSCSFTGHRKIKESHRAKISALVARAIAYAYKSGCRSFYTGGAVGFDTVAAQEVLRFRMFHPDVKLILLLPSIDQDKYWTAAQRASYEYVLSVSDEVVYVSEEYTDTCIKERNMQLAKRADILIAYLGHSRSGSAQTVRMAERLGKEVYNLYPTLEKGE